LKKNKVQKRSKKESLSIRFANYSKVSNELLEKIKYCFGEIKASVILDGRQYSRININRLSYNKIIDIMNDIEVNCFQYKFNKKVCKKDRNIKEL